MTNNNWTRPVSRDLVDRYCRCMGLEDASDQRWFSKHNLLLANAGDRILQEMGAELSSMYVPCKREYVGNLPRVRGIITVLKQLCREVGIDVVCRETNVTRMKVMLYRLGPEARFSVTRTPVEVRWE